MQQTAGFGLQLRGQLALGVGLEEPGGAGAGAGDGLEACLPQVGGDLLVEKQLLESGDDFDCLRLIDLVGGEVKGHGPDDGDSHRGWVHREHLFEGDHRFLAWEPAQRVDGRPARRYGLIGSSGMLFHDGKHIHTAGRGDQDHGGFMVPRGARGDS